MGMMVRRNLLLRAEDTPKEETSAKRAETTSAEVDGASQNQKRRSPKRKG